MYQTTIRIVGMSCGQCERRVEEVAKGEAGTISARADAKAGTLILVFDGDEAAFAAYRELLARALAEANYPIAEESRGNADASAGQRAAKGSPAAGGTAKTTAISLLVGAGLVALMIILDHAGLFSLTPSIGSTMGFGALLLAGFLTSFHCIAMCGGIALSQSLGGAEPEPGNRTAALREGFWRTLAYNGGRVVSYTAIGAAAGALGSGIPLGQTGRAVLMGIAGVLMVFAAAKIGGLIRLPALRVPAWDRFRERAGAKADRLGPFAVGLANGFMPCGPLQAMQLYALGTGSALSGALAMLAFSLGTVPVMAGFGAGATLVKPAWRIVANKAGAILVAFLGLATVSRAWAIAGLPSVVPTIADTAFSRPARAGGQTPPAGGQTPPAGQAPAAGKAETAAAGTAAAGQVKTIGVVATMKDGYQEAIIDLGPRSYGEITVQKGIPVRFVIRADARAINGCNNAVVIPAFKIQKGLLPGDNVIEFTPTAAGLIPYSCWMGMINSRILVVDSLAGQGGK